MNILFVIHFPNYGGPHNQALMLRDIMHSKGYETIVVLPDEPGNAAIRLRQNKVEVIQMKLHRVRATLDLRDHWGFITGFFREISTLRKIIRKRKVKIVVIGGLVNPHGAIAGWLEKVAVVWQILDTRTPKLLRPFFYPLIKIFSDAVMCTGKRVANEHPGLNLISERIYYYVPPVNPLLFKPDSSRRSRAREYLCIGSRDICIGSVGNITPQKGFEFLIAAAAAAKKKHKNIKIRILGQKLKTHKEYIFELERAAVKAGLEIPSLFQIIDPGDMIADLLPGFDIFVMASVQRSEGIPTAILEAMACEIPVIATDTGAIGEVICHGNTGFIVPDMNVQAITGYVVKLIGDPSLAMRMGDSARKSILKKYGIDKSALSHEIAFKSAVKRNTKLNYSTGTK